MMKVKGLEISKMKQSIISLAIGIVENDVKYEFSFRSQLKNDPDKEETREALGKSIKENLFVLKILKKKFGCW